MSSSCPLCDRLGSAGKAAVGSLYPGLCASDGSSPSPGNTTPTACQIIDALRSIPVPSLNVWAESFWRTFYFVMKSYPEDPTPEEQAAVQAFFKSQAHLLPCHRCREHYVEWIPGLEWAKTSQAALALWLFGLHNNINERNGRHVYSFDESIGAVKRMVRDPLESGDSGTRAGSKSATVPAWTIALVCLLGVGIGVGIGVAMSKRRGEKKR